MAEKDQNEVGNLEDPEPSAENENFPRFQQVLNLDDLERAEDGEFFRKFMQLVNSNICIYGGAGAEGESGNRASVGVPSRSKSGNESKLESPHHNLDKKNGEEGNIAGAEKKEETADQSESVSGFSESESIQFKGKQRKVEGFGGGDRESDESGEEPETAETKRERVARLGTGLSDQLAEFVYLLHGNERLMEKYQLLRSVFLLQTCDDKSLTPSPVVVDKIIVLLGDAERIIRDLKNLGEKERNSADEMCDGELIDELIWRFNRGVFNLQCVVKDYSPATEVPGSLEQCEEDLQEITLGLKTQRDPKDMTRNSSKEHYRREMKKVMDQLWQELDS